MSQKYGQSRRGRPSQGYNQYRSSSGPRGSPREHHGLYRPPPQAGGLLPHLEGAYANQHLTHSIASLLGSLVEARLTNGTVFEGILTEVSPKLEISLEAVHDKAKSATKDNVQKRMRVSFGDIVYISAKEQSNLKYASSDIFKTDAEISQSNGPSGSRDLQPFDFDEGTSIEHLDSDSTGWSVDDMFLVNKEKFDVSSTYDEEMAQYTTKLERDDTEDFRQREARAAKIAQEIETKDKKRYGIDDTGTEEELFSAVVRRQEMATPPLTDTTPIRYNRGTPSVSNENRNVAPPPPAAATVGTNSIPKTDTSSADDSSRYKNELLSSSQPAVPSVSSSGLGSTKTFTAIEDGESADSAIKGHTVSTCRESEEATSDKTGKFESSSASGEEKPPSPVDSKTAVAVTPSRKAEVEPVTAAPSEANEKESAIKTFKLNPEAKAFTPTFSLSSTTPPTASASSSPALSSSSSSARSSSSTPYIGGGGKKSSFRGSRHPRGQHQPAGSAYIQPDLTSFIPSPSSVGQAGFVIQTQPFGMRPSVHTPPTAAAAAAAAGQVFYATHLPQYPGAAAGLMAQPGMIPPQQLVAASPKFVTEIQAQPQVIGQHYPQTSQAPQFIQHPSAQALLQPTVSQQQLVPTPQGLVNVSAHQPIFNVGLATGTGATVGTVTGTAGGLVGGVPFPYHHHQALVAAASATQQPGAGGGAVGVASQTLAGVPVAASRQMFQHQSHQIGK